MKILYLSLVFFGLSLFVKEKKVSKIVIKKADFSIQTVVGWDCDSFPTSCKVDIDSITIFDRKSINEIIQYVNSARQISNYSIDARAKMYIYFNSGEMDTLCLGTTPWILRNGKPYELKSLDLINMIEKLK